ncbi:MAG: hypothetical protein AMXMBFR13_16940 [Phycisphaerae bacterium]
MSALLVVRAVGIWGVILVVAVLNGTARQFLLAPHLSERAAHQVSSIVLAGLILLISTVLVPFLGMLTTGQLAGIGLMWTLLTVAFEFALGLLTGRSWDYMLADYNLPAGRLWVVVLAAVFVGPIVAARLRGTWR